VLQVSFAGKVVYYRALLQETSYIIGLFGGETCVARFKDVFFRGV